ncbi:PLP-dependent aminotransferase family protein [Arthrobacter sp. ISL-85]|uniref:MocR-like transcription factor YczR n=1 Tax=Arthrobacter sp. ISL-85 TaxID=2819115 RepID=UPI001BE99F3F|nr:PLP-dependent aminotransferase family protein [Arthrobacter sp. ISL-85]MBT2566894.1 PLP-dependent aminotransferase family protein [Arthrobacter sp. ISL-85]
MAAALTALALSRLLGPWNSGPGPAYRELADVVRLLILDGRIPLDTALPSERSLCSTLAVSRTTITAAYSSLRDQGFLSSGQGSRGKTRIPELTPFGPALFGPQPPSAGALAAPGLTAPGLTAPGLTAPGGLVDLAYSALPASGEVVHRAFAAALTELPALLPGFGYDALGLLPLRQAIADRYTAAGVPTQPGQVMVTSGAQHALTIIIRTLADRQDRILVEHPSYPHALDAIRSARCRPVPVAFAESGWDLTAMESVMAQQQPKLAYLVPDFHNPTGMIMPDAQRRRLARAAALAETVLVADETLRDLNLDGVATTPLAGFSSAVVSIGSLSKSHWAGLRTGWIRASEAMIQRFAAARTTLDLGGPVMEQLAAAHLVRALEEPLPALLQTLRRNRSALLGLLAEHLPAWQVTPPAGGLSVWCRLPAPISTALTVLAPEFGIRLAAGPRFGIGGAFERNLRVPFTLPPDRLEIAVLALRAAQDRLDAAPQLRRSLTQAPAVAIA